MQIQINGKIERTDAIDQHIRQRVEAELRHHAAQVTRVEVHLSDVNADKGGVDKRCLVEVRLAGHQPLVAEDTGEDLYTVVSKAAERVNRVVAHHLGRLHDRR